MSYLMKSSSISSGTSNSRTTSRYFNIVRKHLDSVLESFILSLDLNHYKTLNKTKKSKYLEDFNVAEIYNALQKINEEISFAKIEIHVLHDFILKNDPKMLFGYEKARENVTRYTLRWESMPSLSQSKSISYDGSINRSYINMMKRPIAEYRIGYRAKIEMTEKISNELSKYIQKMHFNAIQIMRKLNAHITNISITNEETVESTYRLQNFFTTNDRKVKNFDKEKKLMNTLARFLKNWTERAQVLVLSIRLHRAKVIKKCFQLRNEIRIKSPLNMSINFVDYELLVISRNTLARAVDTQGNYAYDLKNFFGEISRYMNQIKRYLETLEKQAKHKSVKIRELKHANASIIKEFNEQIETYKKDSQILRNMKENLKRFQAPSISEYFESKKELILSEREEKLLEKKIKMAKMIFQRIKRRKHIKKLKE